MWLALNHKLDTQYYIETILHDRAEIRNLSSSVEKYFTSEHSSTRVLSVKDLIIFPQEGTD